MCVTNTAIRSVAAHGIDLCSIQGLFSESASPVVPIGTQAGNEEKQNVDPELTSLVDPVDNVDEKRQQMRQRSLAPRLDKAAKNHSRHYVVHEYHDRAQQDKSLDRDRPYRIPNALFPAKLHYVLRDAKLNGWEDIVSWAPHGRCFAIHNPNKFVTEIMPQ
jgi:HSF-type DNA-binding